MYDADVGRFLSLDPLAADFPSWSDYNYVLGNPVIFVNPDGKDTAYYSESGKLLHYSYDDAENAVTIVPNKKLAHFLYLTGGYENSSLTIESTRELRSLGVSYIMKVLLSFYSEYRTNTKSCYLQNTYDLSLEEIIYVIYPDGSRMEGGVFAEHGMILYASQDRLTVSTGGKAYTNKRPEFNFLYPLAGDDNYVGNVHLHPDVGEYKFQTRESSTVGRIYTKIIKSMATKGDQDAKNDSKALNGNGFYNIAIDDKHLHFYNGNTQFKVEKNIFDE